MSWEGVDVSRAIFFFTELGGGLLDVCFVVWIRHLHTPVTSVIPDIIEMKWGLWKWTGLVRKGPWFPISPGSVGVMFPLSGGAQMFFWGSWLDPVLRCGEICGRTHSRAGSEKIIIKPYFMGFQLFKDTFSVAQPKSEITWLNRGRQFPSRRDWSALSFKGGWRLTLWEITLL